MMSDWCLIIQDRLWQAHDAAGCPDMRRMWLSKIRNYQRKGGADNGEILSADGRVRRADGRVRRSVGGDIVLLDRKRRVKA
jgi:hypothetical protein